MSWLGAAFDLTIVALLLWPRTRRFGCVLVLGFHGATGLLFPIGIFPWLMSAAATILLAPDWPRHALDRIAARLRTPRAPRVGHVVWRPRAAVPFALALF